MYWLQSRGPLYMPDPTSRVKGINLHSEQVAGQNPSIFLDFFYENVSEIIVFKFLMVYLLNVRWHNLVLNNLVLNNLSIIQYLVTWPKSLVSTGLTEFQL